VAAHGDRLESVLSSIVAVEIRSGCVAPLVGRAAQYRSQSGAATGEVNTNLAYSCGTN
jgi:hypothetical protein